MSPYIAAIDQGTTSTRCMLFDPAGPVAAAQQEHAQLFPHPGWVEHDPLEIWQRTQQTIAAALTSAQARGDDVAALGITNQRETTLLWDRHTGLPLHNAIVWQDARTKEMCDVLAAEDSQGINRFRAIVGLPLATYFSGPKLRWLLENVPQATAAAKAGDALFGTMDTYLIWQLTGGPNGGAHVTDVTNASRTMLMNLHTLDWDESMLRVFGVEHKMLPRIVASSDPAPWGHTLVEGPFKAAIPVCGDLGDQQAALVGQTCFAPGQCKNTYGTGCFMLLNTGQKPVQSDSGLLTTLAYKFGSAPAVYALEGSIAMAGALVQWLRDNLGLIQKSSDIEALAQTVPDNGGIYIVPAFSGLFAPWWRSDARGIIAGLSQHTNKAHLARAILEATAYQSRDVLDAMNKDSPVPLRELKVDGGMAVNNLLMQFQADLLGVDVVRPRVTETTALGAAYAAGLAVGFWNSLDDLCSNWREDRTFHPQISPSQRDQLHHAWLKAVQRALNWVE